MKTIPYGHQYIDQQDINSVVKVLKADWLTQGPVVKNFEEALCEYTGAKYAVAVSNGTAALHLAMMALNIGKGDEILTSPITFAASANCAVYVGAHPKFIDINDSSYQMNVSQLEEYLAKPANRKNLRAIVLVHFMGAVANVKSVYKLCRQYKLKLVEDASHAIGAQYLSGQKLHRVGACRHSDFTTFSFHPIKHMTTGEGGAILTNNRSLYQRLLQLRHHGVSRPSGHPRWFYDIEDIGFNYRITDFQCALGLSQLKKLDRMVNRRRVLIRRYSKLLQKIDALRLPLADDFEHGAYHLYVIRVKNDQRNELYEYLRKHDVLTQVNYIPVHLLSYYQKKFGYRRGDFPAAEYYYDECLSLPLYYGLTNKQQDYVIEVINEFFSQR